MAKDYEEEIARAPKVPALSEEEIKARKKAESAAAWAKHEEMKATASKGAAKKTPSGRAPAKGAYGSSPPAGSPSSPPSGSGSLPPGSVGTPTGASGGASGNDELNFPGFQCLADVNGILTKGLSAQSGLLNEAWQAIIGAKYDVKDYMRTVARSYQTSFRTMESLFQYPIERAIPKVPEWRNLDIPLSSITGPIYRAVDVHPFGPDVLLATTQLAPFGPVTHRLRLNAFENPDQKNQILLHIPAVITAAAEDETGLEHLGTLRPPVNLKGQYLALVYDSRQASQPPLLVVTLRIT